ncbi:MAG: OmpA family protein [Alphaproteobacteria bacterium]|nr:OmpA family protein [Alphaproteobacteria bacterium]MBU1517274.1 OmpA family protein [Alphaproteobacteria bacterium]MBU2093190.1 OmpA family protein [Alphaproteobacteria bacterium]MBU2154239.1 OmpA family protein [Alphaproteobacteria bacterium]MBU2305870.1 OmpA family protein [Alphaproteobacteria bacterium]
MKTAIVTSLALLVGLGGCSTMTGARDAVVRAPTTCQDVTIPIYFEPDQAGLTPEGRRVISSQAAQAKRCRIDAVRVVGLADAAGDPAANLELSKARAASVADALEKAGLPAAEFDVVAVGQAGSVAADGAVRPVRRRADITLKLANPT